MPLLFLLEHHEPQSNGMVAIRYIFILLRIKNRSILDSNRGRTMYFRFIWILTCSYETKPVVRSLKLNFFVRYSVIKGKTFIETAVFFVLLRVVAH